MPHPGFGVLDKREGHLRSEKSRAAFINVHKLHKL